jgi:asparagine synthase (glutamine-hydrolysing)
VVLSGDGGDELFGGYSRYVSLAASERMRGSVVEWVILRALSRLVRERFGSLHRRSVAVGLASRWPDLAVRCAMSQVNMRAPERRGLWGGTISGEADATGAFVGLPDASVTGLNRALHFDLTCYLPGDILPKVDRAAMAHGLETRAPLLDRDLAEFVLRLPASMKVADHKLKVVFRAACEDLWPDTVKRRAKQGFGAPYVGWLGRADVGPLLARVFGPQSPLRAMLPGLAPGIPARDYRTWTLLTLGLWLEQHNYA